MLGGILYLGGAIGVERATEVYTTKAELNSLPYHLWNGLEEGLEMAGILVFLGALVRATDAEEAGAAPPALPAGAPEPDR